jgi:acetyl esterase/lipase
MRRLSLPILILLYLNSQIFSNVSKKNYILSGKIHNYESAQISIQNKNVALSEDGNFFFSKSIDSPFYVFIDFGKKINLYVHPGDSLFLEIDADQELNSIKVSGDRQEINKFLIQDEYEAEKVMNYFNKNYTTLFQLDEKDYVNQIDEFQRPFKDRLKQFIINHKITDEYFIKTQQAIMLYSYADNLLKYPNWHRKFLANKVYQPSDCYYDFLKQVNFNDAELLNIKEYRTFLDVYLKLFAEKELQNESLYSNKNYKSIRAKMNVVLKTFTNPTVRSEMLYSFSKQFFGEYYHKNIDNLINAFRTNCVNQDYLQEINRVIEYDKSVREKCKILVFKKIDNIELDVFVYLPTDYLNGDKRAALAFFHGGGWECGKPEWGHGLCQHFSKFGMVCFSFEYRLTTQHDVTPLESIADAKSAIRWIREFAEEYNINPEKIVASGYSAGGHLAACTTMIDKFDEATEDRAISSAANALMFWVTPVKVFADGWFKQILKGRAKVKECDPDEYIRSGLPPSIIFQGTADDIIPLWSVKQFAGKMKAAGNRCELNIYEGQTHLGWGENVKDVYAKMDAFLASLGYLGLQN